MQKPLFLQFQASRFSIKKRSTNHVFFKPLLGPPFSHFFLFFSKMVDFGTPLKIQWVKNPLRVRGRTQQSVSGWFLPVAVSISCTAPYLTSPFLYVISLGKCICRYPAIAVARKGGVLGAQQIENGSKISSRNCCFFNFSKNHENQEQCLFFNTFQGF